MVSILLWPNLHLDVSLQHISKLIFKCTYSYVLHFLHVRIYLGGTNGKFTAHVPNPTVDSYPLEKVCLWIRAALNDSTSFVCLQKYFCHSRLLRHLYL